MASKNSSSTTRRKSIPHKSPEVTYINSTPAFQGLVTAKRLEAISPLRESAKRFEAISVEKEATRLESIDEDAQLVEKKLPKVDLSNSQRFVVNSPGPLRMDALPSEREFAQRFENISPGIESARRFGSNLSGVEATQRFSHSLPSSRSSSRPNSRPSSRSNSRPSSPGREFVQRFEAMASLPSSPGRDFAQRLEAISSGREDSRRTHVFPQGRGTRRLEAISPGRLETISPGKWLDEIPAISTSGGLAPLSSVIKVPLVVRDITSQHLAFD